MYIAILIAVNLFQLAFVVIPFSRHEAWWIRVFDFPRLQTFCLGCLLLIVELFVLDLTQTISYLPLAMTALFLLAQGWWIYPYTKLASAEVKWAKPAKDSARVSLLCCNVLTPNREAKRLLKLVDEWQPDLLVTLESDDWWEEQLESLTEQYPHSVKCPLDNLYGMHVYSRLPFEDSQLQFLVEDNVPSIHVLVRLAGQPVRIHFLHPAPPSPTENDESTERDGELMRVAKYIRERQQQKDVPTIVAGDLNDVAWSATTRLFRKVSGLLDPRVGRGMWNSFHAKWWFARWPLDHIFHSDHFTLVKLCRLPPMGSDHFPIYTQLQLAPSRRNEQDGLDLEGDEKAWAEEKIEQVENGNGAS
ncbi:endonuclease/exonuclease/phosphatase family protein [Aliidiomarina soli]|uniref:endonuclease/exonuclease/phosphatase family protein n=1 Tax=Aliidiomarina soli TaxID=1928574 RepID=UPI0018E58C5B|nr:endonuclease/exonuclease/phosphatase family protein [Aliidiomarina soli]